MPIHKGELGIAISATLASKDAFSQKNNGKSKPQTVRHINAASTGAVATGGYNQRQNTAANGMTR